MATIRKLRGKWQAQIRRKGSPHVTKSFFRKTDAIAWANEIEAEVRKGELSGNLMDRERLSVRDILDRYKLEILPSHRAGENQSIIVNAFQRKPIAKLKLANVETHHFAAYRNQRLETVKPATIIRELSIIQHAFDIAIRDWGIPLRTNPLKDVRRPRVGNARERRLCKDEFERLSTASERTRNPWIKPLYPQLGANRFRFSS